MKIEIDYLQNNEKKTKEFEVSQEEYQEVCHKYLKESLNLLAGASVDVFNKWGKELLSLNEGQITVLNIRTKISDDVWLDPRNHPIEDKSLIIIEENNCQALCIFEKPSLDHTGYATIVYVIDNQKNEVGFKKGNAYRVFYNGDVITHVEFNLYKLIHKF